MSFEEKTSEVTQKTVFFLLVYCGNSYCPFPLFPLWPCFAD